ncbi:MAG TPA: response regulator transcription factor [Chitinophagaceae bacterium]|jgi:DNA-binding NarL/FixJ family response regulator
MKKLIVLVVEDSPLITERFAEILNEMDNVEQIFYARNYTEGKKLLDEIKPDIALLDINLPGKSGIDVLRLIRQQRPEINVIMITNQVTDHYKRICAALGAQYFFDKSNEFEQVPEIISNFQLS